MGGECSTFYEGLSKVLSERRDTPRSVVVNWVRTKTLFASLKSCLLCLRKSRSLNHNVATIEDDINLSNEISRIT